VYQTLNEIGEPMYTLLLAIIYLAFIGLGASDALFGSLWPTIQTEMVVPISYAGIVSMLAAGGTIASSLMSARLVKRFGAGKVVVFSVFISAAVLLSISFAGSFWIICLLALPLGLAGGSVDATINNHVALHYTSRHMSWLHCFWGLGAVISPIIMGYALTAGASWNSGYRIIFGLQITIMIILLLSQPFWKKQDAIVEEEQKQTSIIKLPQLIRIPGVKYLLLTFFAYCAVEVTAGLWASTFLVQQRGIATETAAGYAALFFIGVTVGRFISGFIANKISTKNMVRFGIAIIFVGILAVMLPISANWLALGGLIVIGLGCAPIFPALVHSTPIYFGKAHSQSIIGAQIASAYTGSTLMPPLFGFIAAQVGIGLYPFYLLAMAFLMLLMTERLTRVVTKEV